MDELLNPYRPGAGTIPPALIGRDALIDRFGIAMRRTAAGRPGKSMMVVGLRGVGKTVLLNRFAEISEQEGFSVAFIEAPENADFPALLAARLRKVLLKLDRGPVSATVRKALGVLKSFSLKLPGVSIQLDVPPAKGEADSGLLAEDMTDLLVAVGEAARDRDLGLLIAIDEVQYLRPEELGAAIVAIHRTTQLNLPIMLVGAGLPQLPGLAGDAKSYAERLFEFPEVGPLNPQDSEEALRAPAEIQGITVAKTALRALAEASAGYPYFLQEWGYHVWNVADGPKIRLADVESARPLVRQSLDENFFRVRLDRLTPKEREYVRAMAALGEGPHRSGDIAGELGVSVEKVAPRRASMIRKGMIYSPAYGDTAFTVPLFDDFLRRTLGE